MMKTQSRTYKKVLLAVAAFVSFAIGLCALNFGGSEFSASAASQTLIEFTQSDTSLSDGNGSYETNVDTDGNGVVDAASVWKLNPTQASSVISVGNVSLGSGTKKVQIRMYVHWGTLDSSTGETNGEITVKFNGVPAGYLGSSQWSGGSDDLFRPLVQDEWMTLTVETNNTELTSLGFDFKNTGITAESNAFVYVDKLSVMTASAEKGKNVVTEFAWDEVNYTGKGWRTDLVSDVDTDGNGIVDAENAWRIGVTQKGLSFAGTTITMDFAETIDFSAKLGTNLNGIQYRMYLHLGEITGAYNIEAYINGGLVANWSSASDGNFDVTRPIVQDEWITFTLASGFSITSLSNVGFKFPAGGINYYPCAYVLIDKITTVENTETSDATILTEFGADQIDQAGKGWRTDLAINVDTDGDGKIDADNAWRINLDMGSAATGIKFATPINISAYAGIQMRVYVHWASSFGVNSQISLCANNTDAYKPNGAYDKVFALWKGLDESSRPMIQDEWITFTFAENITKEVPTISSLGIYITADGAAAYDEAYMLIDKIVAIPKTAQSLGENVLAEFDATQVSHNGKGWRTDLVTPMDENSQGVDNAWRVSVNALAPEPTIAFANTIDLDNVECLQFRVYLHLGASIDDENTILGFKGDGQLFTNWRNYGQHEKFRQDEWVTFTLSPEETAKLKTNTAGELNTLALAISKGGTAFYDDAYILFDKIIAAPATAKSAGTLVEFGWDDIDYTGKGWRTDIVTAADEKYECESGYRLRMTEDAGTTPNFKIMPFSLDGVKSFRIRMYIHWGEVKTNPSALLFILKDGTTESSLVYLSSDTTLTQDEWVDVYINPTECAKQIKTVSEIYVQKFAGADFVQHSDAYILFDKIYTNMYEVNLHYEDESQNTTVTVAEDDVLSANLGEKPGYDVEWFTNSEKTAKYDLSSAVKGNLDLYAGYTIKKYTVTFNHGDNIAADVLNNVEYGSKITAAEGKKTGYTVVWYTDAELTQPFDFANTAISGNLELYAKYTAIEYTVTFVHGGEVENEEVKADYGTKITPASSKKGGYGVVWCVDEQLTQPFDFANTAISGNISLYAKYSPEKYTVTFNHGDNIAADVLNNVDYGSKITAAESKKTGHTVVWYTDAELTQPFDFANTAISGNLELYAKYTAIEYTVTFNHGGDIAAESKNVAYGGKVTAAESKKEGYTVEWYIDAELTQPFDFANTAISGNLELYAKYTAIEYTVTFNHGGDIAAESKNVVYGGKVTA
ncbi:MAG: InlB B-repeat-containing protein, partial [Candidatus Borkfalkiaceae bacterium]|nr:InlB B-repeat-containing protein [Christensenellaceae bacterium]